MFDESFSFSIQILLLFIEFLFNQKQFFLFNFSCFLLYLFWWRFIFWLIFNWDIWYLHNLWNWIIQQRILIHNMSLRNFRLRLRNIRRILIIYFFLFVLCNNWSINIIIQFTNIEPFTISDFLNNYLQPFFQCGFVFEGYMDCSRFLMRLIVNRF